MRQLLIKASCQSEKIATFDPASPIGHLELLVSKEREFAPWNRSQRRSLKRKGQKV